MTKTPSIWMIQTQRTSKGALQLFEVLGQRVRVVRSVTDALAALRGEIPSAIFLHGPPDQRMLGELQRLRSVAPNVALFLLNSLDEMENFLSKSGANADGAAKNEATSGLKDLYQLSHRERQVLGLMVKGFINKEIAETLSISYFTVENHQRKIYEKLRVHTRTAAVAKALLEKLCFE